MAPKLRTFYAFIALLTLCAGVVAQGKAPDTVPEHLRCADNRKIILSCKTEKNRLLQLCDAGDSVVYSYGRFNEKPQLTFANKKVDISGVVDNSNLGRWFGFGFDLKNGTNAIYKVQHNTNTQGNTVFAGVAAYINGKNVANDECLIDTEETYQIDFERLEKQIKTKTIS